MAAAAGALPVLPALGELLPGGLPRGTVVAAGGWGLAQNFGAQVRPFQLRGVPHSELLMELAARRHNGQRRKGRGDEAYINHLAEVANML